MMDAMEGLATRDILTAIRNATVKTLGVTAEYPATWKQYLRNSGYVATWLSSHVHVAA